MSSPDLVQDDEFEIALDELRELHNKKKADYSDPENRFSNFEVAGQFSGILTTKVFEVLLGVKQARLMELSDGRKPNNESLLDTYRDRAVYSILAYIYFKKVHPKSVLKELER